MFDAVSNPLPPADRMTLCHGKAPRYSWSRTIPGPEWVDRHLLSGENIGCKTGRGVWVLDFDRKHGGLEALAALEAAHGRIPGWRVRTGSGGIHIYLHGVPGQRSIGKLPVLSTGLGVELKADGSQVVWRGSVHPETDCYYVAIDPDEWKPGRLPDAPDWLVGLAGSHSTAPTSSGGFYRPSDWPPTADFVEAITGHPVGRDRRARCPIPTHPDDHPSLYADPRKGFYCSACGIGGGPRQLAAIVLGLGTQDGTRWLIESPDDRAAVDAFLRERGIEL